jgi:glycosyltransferase involved in cell wall biosynthesis
LEAAGVPLLTLGKTGRWDILMPLLRLRNALRSFGPEVLYSFLNIPNVLAAAVSITDRRTSLVWGIRNSGVFERDADWLMRLAAWAERKLAGRADLLIANSYAGGEGSKRWGISPECVRVIPNGVDTHRFAPLPKIDGLAVHSRGNSSEPLTIGMVGRLCQAKGYRVLLQAAVNVVGQLRDGVRFVLIGEGHAEYAEELRQLSISLGLSKYVVWARPRREIEDAYRSFDVYCMSSISSEGMPNAVAEAMACEVPCVVTDVGDAAIVVGDTGWVVPPGDPTALCNAILRALRLSHEERRELGRAARARIKEHFSVARMVEATVEALTCR